MPPENPPRNTSVDGSVTSPISSTPSQLFMQHGEFSHEDRPVVCNDENTSETTKPRRLWEWVTSSYSPN